MDFKLSCFAQDMDFTLLDTLQMWKQSFMHAVLSLFALLLMHAALSSVD